MRLLKNTTPYIGKVFLKFEQNPNYQGRTLLNSVILNLGFTKLVSRVQPDRDMDGFKIDPVKIDLIRKYTDGQIGTHTFGPNGESTLPNSFLSDDGQYIGSIKEAWWYYKNAMTVCPERPSGVAIIWRVPKGGTIADGTDGIDSYYGYSHRGGGRFKIGDMLFDPEYVPQESHYTKAEWASFEKDRAENQARYDADMEDYTVTIKSVMPFQKRGEVVIQNWNQAQEAAINLSNYLS